MAEKGVKPEIKGIKDFPKHGISPFFKGLYQVKRKNKTIAVGKQYGLFDARSGEIAADKTAFMGIRKIVDRGEFIKVYRGSLTVLFDLSPKAQKVYAYFMEGQKMNDHEVYFSLDECREFTAYGSNRSIYEGITELLEKGFIARAIRTNWFYINPEISFNGDRLVQWNEWIVKGTKAHDEAMEKEAQAMQLDLEQLLEKPR